MERNDFILFFRIFSIFRTLSHMSDMNFRNDCNKIDCICVYEGDIVFDTLVGDADLVVQFCGEDDGEGVVRQTT